MALGFSCLWIAILSIPMWSGHYLAGQYSDQFATGYAFRWWGANQIATTHHIPLWNPYAFVGFPTVAGFGDLFYPLSALRLVFPTALAIDLEFVLHYVLAGFALYLLLRMLRFSWTAALTGGTAYQLSGVVVSLVSPGHDGKLFVTALLPVIMIGLVLGIRRRRWEGFALSGLGVGLALLSPQYQMTQYALLASGLFALYLAFGEPEGLAPRDRWLALAGAAGAVVLGFGISMIQVLPFFHNIPYSPRAEAATYEWSSSFGLPWTHVPELFLSGFAGHYETYWGPNILKFHSEYLGLPVLALAAVGAGTARRRLAWWMLGIGGLFLLVSLGGHTPFYRLWWAVVPYVKKTRAPGMALYVVALATAVFAAMGVERLERGEGKQILRIALGAAGFVALLALAGVFGSMAEGLAKAVPPTARDPVQAAIAAGSGIRIGALGSALGLGLVASLGLAFLTGRVRAPVFGLLLVTLIGGDLYRAGREFWSWSKPEQELFAPDDLIRRIQAAPQPARVLNLDVYRQMSLMRLEIPQLLGGLSSVELLSFDALMGLDSQGRFANLGRIQLWNLLAIRFVILPDTQNIPGYHLVLGPVTTGAGQTAFLYEADTVPSYLRVIPAAAKAEADRIVPTLTDPRMDYDRIVLYDTAEAINPVPVTGLPPASPSRAHFTHWAPGRMTIALDPPPPQDSYLLISENWYPDWHATVDGQPATALRGDQTFLTIPVKAGSKQVELAFSSEYYARGKLVTIASLLLLAVWAGAAAGWRRMRRGG
ncbi:MAG TPA: YfhO family protein [Gemmatimonadales bacterium]